MTGLTSDIPSLVLSSLCRSEQLRPSAVGGAALDRDHASSPRAELGRAGQRGPGRARLLPGEKLRVSAVRPAEERTLPVSYHPICAGRPRCEVQSVPLRHHLEIFHSKRCSSDSSLYEEGTSGGESARI